MRVWTNGEKWYVENKDGAHCVMDSEGLILKCRSLKEAKWVVTNHNVAMVSLYDRLTAYQHQKDTGQWPNWGDRPDGFDGPNAA